MGDSKRWTVTYAKHIKQKRKVYQDGFLELHVSTTKVALFDECEKLLECRLLNNDETVTSGETLVFNGYLVDVGDPEGNSKPEPNLNVDGIHKNRSRFRSPSVDAKDSKMNEKENVGRVQGPLSPSQKIIREFKKRELLKYGSPKVSQEAPKPSTEEWQVLYTTQVTQKAKKYHDGFLRLVLRGSSGGQVMLFNTNRKLLDSRFFKKDDVIKPGESITFDSYLVDIGEHQGSCTPDSNFLGDKCTNVKRMQMDKKKTSLETDDTHVTVGKSEWQVLYTTQLTQKAKKYQDGFLQIELCGSFGRQAILCDLSKRPIERRFLKKNEVISAGESLYFGGHLVEVGEPDGSLDSQAKLNERGTGNNVERRQPEHGENGFRKVNPFFAKGKPPSELCPGKDSGLNSLIIDLKEIKSSKITSTNRPLRDANQILSILQASKPKPQESYATGGLSLSGSRSRQSIGDKESTETVKSLDITSSGGAWSGSSLQFTENDKLSQSYSQKDAQTNTSKTEFGDQSCLITNQGKSGEEFSCEGETFPSFDLGF